MNRTDNTGINPFVDPALVAGYETWYQTAGRRADRLEKDLLARLLARLSPAWQCSIQEQEVPNDEQDCSPDKPVSAW